MGRGKHFKHKTQGQDHKLPESAEQVSAKRVETVEYSIDTVATAEHGPVSFKVEKQ